MNIREMSLKELIKEMYVRENQEEKNMIAYEITCRVYVPFKDKTFEELLLEIGYIPIEKDTIRQK